MFVFWISLGEITFSSEKVLGRVPLLSIHLSPIFFCFFVVQMAVASEKVLWLPSGFLWGKWLSPRTVLRNCSLQLSPSVLRLGGAIGSFEEVLWKVPRTVLHICF